MNDLLARMGINTDDLGCVMLDVDPLPRLHEAVPDALWYRGPEVPGPEKDAHITLLYGLLRPAHEWREFVDEVLAGWEMPGAVEVNGFEVFGRDSDLYDCIVGTLSYSSSIPLRSGNSLLRRLPHIETFAYTPHLTIGYVLKGTGRLIIPELNEIRQRSGARRSPGSETTMQTLVNGLNYGSLRS